MTSRYLPLWIAELETPRYSFRAVGRTEAEARENMRKAWGRHRRQYPGVASFDCYEDGVVTWEASVHTMNRDHSPLRARPRA